ncbi:hypothetical protein [[Flexibacter] sp. ATCC 35208]|uniref:hypothetical protein n=1 Tax=[Flexibacter] sp. ATCC 35208 TaxID=1936242 RepID=UPI001C6FC9BB
MPHCRLPALDGICNLWRGHSVVLLWAWLADNFKPYFYDLICALVALIGVCIIFYAPQTIH